MQKKLVLFFVLFLFSSVQAFGAGTITKVQPGSLVFCKAVTDQWEAVDAADTFDTNLVSWISLATQEYGTNEIILSIYMKNPNNQGENLLYREKMPVRAAWNLVVVKDIPLPGEGEYIVAYESTNGDPITTGQVKIVNKIVDEPMPAKIEGDGTSLKEIFSKYKTQTK